MEPQPGTGIIKLVNEFVRLTAISPSGPSTERRRKGSTQTPRAATRALSGRLTTVKLTAMDGASPISKDADLQLILQARQTTTLLSDAPRTSSLHLVRPCPGRRAYDHSRLRRRFLGLRARAMGFGCRIPSHCQMDHRLARCSSWSVPR
jgi:hypothetical protein